MTDIDALVKLVDEVWRKAFGKSLSLLERSILQGCLQGKADSAIAAENGLPLDLVRRVGEKFWSELSKILGKSFTCGHCSAAELIDAVFCYLDSPPPSLPPQAPPPPSPPLKQSAGSGGSTKQSGGSDRSTSRNGVPQASPPPLPPPQPQPVPLPSHRPPPAVKPSTPELLSGVDDGQSERYSGSWPPNESGFSDAVDVLENELYNQPFVRAGEPDSEKPMRGTVATDLVDCSVFGPNAIALNDAYLIQVFVHLPDQFDLARQRALLADPEAQARATKTLAIAIERNSQLTFELLLPDLEVDTPVQSLAWRGLPASVEFGITTPASLPRQTVIGTVIVSQNSVPLGQLKFKLAVGQPTQEAIPVGHRACRFRKAFVSYSSKDRLEVLKRVQALLLAGIEVFQDVLDLEPGDRWEQQLYRQIARADVFFLFWSSAAKESKWVIQEALYALECQGGKEDQPPEIIPVILEGPPTIPPPPELSHLHFQDRLAYIMAACR